MREDMAKVIVERPRHGGGVRYPRGSVRNTDRVPLEDWHRREGMSRPWDLRGWPVVKNLNENLAPLRRFLRSNVGRPWDKVYAEICQRVNRNSAVQLHIWQHLSDFVCANPYVVDGDVGRHWYTRIWQAFYVDPRTGLLRSSPKLTKRQWRRMPRGEYRQKPLPDPVMPMNDNRCYELTGGVWYELELRKPPASGRVIDGRTGCEMPFEPRLGFRDYRGRRLYVAVRRRLDAKEARRVGRAFRTRFEQEMRGQV